MTSSDPPPALTAADWLRAELSQRGAWAYRVLNPPPALRALVEHACQTANHRGDVPAAVWELIERAEAIAPSPHVRWRRPDPHTPRTHPWPG